MEDASILGVEAETVVLGDVKIGGLLGVNSLLLIGSLFYRGDKHVISYEKGVVDKNGVKRENGEAGLLLKRIYQGLSKIHMWKEKSICQV